MLFDYGGGKARELGHLRKVCAALSREHKIAIELVENKSGGGYDPKEKKITLGVKDIGRLSADHYLGVLVHEIGHVKHSPHKKPEQYGDLYNMLEDERINELLRDEYAGAEGYLSEVQEPFLEAAEQYLSQLPKNYPLCGDHRSIDEALPPQSHDQYDSVRGEMYMRVITKAYLLAEGIPTLGLDVGIGDGEYMAEKLAALLQEARHARREDIPELVKKARETLGLLYSEEKEPHKQHGACMGAQQKEGEGVRGKVMKAVQEGGGGFGTVQSTPFKGDSDRIYTTQDAKALSIVPSMRRKLLAKLRENERTRYEGNKRRGKLEKKTLSRTARRNYRVYHKRIIPKGKKYEAAIIVDTSGSMFGRNERESKRINNALYSAALMSRSLRGIGVGVSLTIYGAQAATILDRREIYSVETIQARLDAQTSATYVSGSNETNAGIAKALPRLLQTGADRQKIMIIITDGGLEYDDIETSRTLIDGAKRKGVDTMIFYVEDDTNRILEDDESRERTILRADELPQACIALVREIAAKEMDA